MRWPFRSRRARVAEFVGDRAAQSAEDFFAGCGLPDDPLARRIAPAVRASVASAGTVGPEFIRASDRYPDELDVLPMWDSIDFLEWIFRFESELGLKVPRIAFEGLTSPFSVADLAHAAYRCLSQRSG